MLPATQDILNQYSQVCGRIIGYQVGQTGAFIAIIIVIHKGALLMNDNNVDVVSLTYGSPRQQIWTFASAIDEYPFPRLYNHKCPYTMQYY